EEEVYRKLDQRMTEATHSVLDTAERYKVDNRTAAYVVSVKRVADAMKARGWY
ncbi:glutamate dehydrogenase, partial [Thermoplasmatales archaeon AK]|nr:glutamate dehydrogenase [Thermoplasmatales archaeon AK]